MKKIVTFFAILALVLPNFLHMPIYSQAAEGMHYQWVVRNSSNQVVTNQGVGLRISILKGSETGQAVYVETQSATTNANGLVSIQIGNGVVVSGSFSGIDWAIGPYFIKTETDPTGGTSYAITQTSQIMSVPIAMYAKTAGSVVTSGSGARFVGELYGGGVIFWVDHTGQHGLIVSMVDISELITWSNVTSSAVGGASSEWNGLSNSTAIAGQGGHTTSAAQLCLAYTNSDYGTGIYSDWYLPARAELNHLWNNIMEVQKTLENHSNPETTPMARISYWSSTEYAHNEAFLISFFGGQAGSAYKNNTAWVRAIRAF